ncbi:MAG: site-specific integrase, partial [Deltaproteobacteria bacterium]|nr:site-specific integrase [Deltaproteobacteria bacterium]
MDQYLKRFEQHIATERNLSPLTVEAYLRDLHQFQDFLEQHNSTNSRENCLEHIDLLLLRQYLAQLHKTCSRTSIARKLSAIKVFFRFLVREGVLEDSPAEA